MLAEVVEKSKMTDKLDCIEPGIKVQLALGIDECEEEKCCQIGRINPKEQFLKQFPVLRLTRETEVDTKTA